MKRSAVYLAVACAILCTEEVQAVPIEFVFKGTVTQTTFDPDDPFNGTIQFDTPIVGKYFFDSTTANSIPPPADANLNGQQGVESPAGAGLINITVVNGSVSDNSSHGIILRGENNRVEGVHASNNGGSGINVGGSSVIRCNTANKNGDRGIQCDGSCVVEDNTALENIGIGIRANGGVVTGNTATSNQGIGIQAGVNALVSNNMAVSNNGDGIDASGGTASTVLGNTVSRNVGFGLRLTASSGYASNVLTANNGGDANPQVLGGIQIGTNVCGTDTVCP